jgi:hypothetical protein
MPVLVFAHLALSDALSPAAVVPRTLLAPTLRQRRSRARVAMAGRRAAAVTALGASIALGGDLFGVTQALLSLAPDEARRARLDLLYPVGGFKRHVAADGSYEFVYPKAWLADQVLSLPKAGTVRSLDSDFVPRAVEARRDGPTLDSAFGPPGGGRMENLSVLRVRLGRAVDFGAMLGEPAAAAQRLLDTSIAAPGSGKTATLNDVKLRADGVLQFAYTVRFAEGTPMAGKVIRNEACVAYDRRTGDLFTLTVLAPISAWDDKLRAIASSFTLTR